MQSTYSQRTYSHSTYSTAVAVGKLDEKMIQSAFRIYEKYYEGVDFKTFCNDLSQKDSVVLLMDASNKELVGFTTLVVKVVQSAGVNHKILYSGDTVIEEDYRGDSKLQVGVLKEAIKERLRNPFSPFWWFLISKGYKTYLIMANNFQNYYPRYDQNTPSEFQFLIDQFSDELFGDGYRKNGLALEFLGRSERLKAATAPVTQSLIDEFPKIKFFIENNPNWHKGEELPCIGNVSWSFIARFLVKSFKKSMKRSKEFKLKRA